MTTHIKRRSGLIRPNQVSVLLLGALLAGCTPQAEGPLILEPGEPVDLSIEVNGTGTGGAANSGRPKPEPYERMLAVVRRGERRVYSELDGERGLGL